MTFIESEWKKEGRGGGGHELFKNNDEKLYHPEHFLQNWKDKDAEKENRMIMDEGEGMFLNNYFSSWEGLDEMAKDNGYILTENREIFDNWTQILTNGTDQQSNSSVFPEHEGIQFSIEFQILIYILYNTIFILAVFGNLIVCLIIFFNYPQIRTRMNYIIFNLAVSDLLMALFCIPFSYIPILLQFWPFGSLLCYLVSSTQPISVFVSSYTLVFLAIERLLAIIRPLKPRMPISKLILIIGLIWFLAIITAIPIMMKTVYIIDSKTKLPLCLEDWSNNEQYLVLVYNLTLMILQYFIPVIIIFVTYFRIALEIWGKKAPGCNHYQIARDIRIAKAKKKTIIISAIVISAYTCSWLPFNLIHLLLSLNIVSGSENDNFTTIYFSCHWLAMAHSAFNPIIYTWINAHFRNAFKSMVFKLKCLCCVQGERINELNRRNTLTTTTSTGHHNNNSNSRASHRSNLRMNNLQNKRQMDCNINGTKGQRGHGTNKSTLNVTISNNDKDVIGDSRRRRSRDGGNSPTWT